MVEGARLAAEAISLREAMVVTVLNVRVFTVQRSVNPGAVCFPLKIYSESAQNALCHYVSEKYMMCLYSLFFRFHITITIAQWFLCPSPHQCSRPATSLVHVSPHVR